MRRRATTAFLFMLLCSITWHVYAAYPSTVYMEDMTWMEIRDKIQAGATIAIIPTGGTEQNGPHLVTGKHNSIVRYTSGEIAKRIGNALVAPVVPYVPTGRIEPPEGHMQFPGTISVLDSTFALMLQDMAGSLKQHGFKLICFIADHGGSQHVQKEVAAKLSAMWQSSGVRVINVSDYYDNNGQNRWVDSVGIKVPNPQAHAGLADTSELMAVNIQGVRTSLRGRYGESDYKVTGAAGDATQAAVSHGRQFLELKIQAAVNQISHVVANVR